MAGKKNNSKDKSGKISSVVKPTDETQEITGLNTAVDEDSMFYDNTAGTIFSADSDAETGNTKAAQKTAQKSQKEKNSGKPVKNKKPILIVVGVLVAVAALIGLYFLIQNFVPNDTGDTTATYPTDENGEQYAVDLKGNKIDSEKDKDGNILSAGIEELISHVPADIKTVEVTNEHGTFEISAETPTEKTTDADGKETTGTGETVYTLKGYEDAPLASGMPDAVANDAAAVTTTNIVDITGANPEEYGLKEPRATAKVTFTNGNTRTITVGNDAPSDAGTYIMVNGDKAIYLVSTDAVDAFLYKTMALLDTTVTEAAEEDGSSAPESVKISGTNFGKTMEFVPNDDTTVSSAYYKMTSPAECFVNVTNGSTVLESLRSVSADEVIAYKPDEKTLAKYGINTKEPYAEITAKFSDTTVHLYAAKPVLNNTDDNDESSSQTSTSSTYVYSPDKKMLFSVTTSRVAWVTTSYEDMVFEYVMKPDLAAIKAIDITAGGKTYSFDISTKTNTDEEGNETSTTVVKCGDKTIDTEKFDIFFQNLESAQVNSVKNGNVSGNAELTVKFTYNTDKDADTYTFYKGDTGKYNFSFDGSTIMGDVFDTYVEKIIEDAPKIAKGEDVTSI